MTSKNLFLNLMKEDGKRRLWPLALSILGNLFAQTIFCAMLINDWEERLKSGQTVLADVQLSFYENILGNGNVPVILLIVTLSLVIAIQGMSYLHSRAKSDLYDSIPVSRTTVFTVSYVNGLLICIVPFVLFHAVSLLIGMSRGYAAARTLTCSFLSMLSFAVMYAAAYSVAVLACVLTGHTVVAIAGAGVLLSVFSIIHTIINLYMHAFFRTCYLEGSAWIGFYTSPAAGLTGLAANMDGEVVKFPADSVEIVVFYLFFTAALFFLCRFLIKIRPSESAGRAMAFKASTPFIKLLILIPVSMLFGIFFYEIMDISGRTRIGWLIFGLVMGLVLSHATIEIIYEFDFRACLKNLHTLALGTLLTALAVGIFIFDIFGYDSFMPAPENVSCAAVSSWNLQQGVSYYKYNKGGWNETLNSDQYRLDNMRLTDIEDVNIIASSGVDYLKSIGRVRLLLSDDDYLTDNGYGYKAAATAEYEGVYENGEGEDGAENGAVDEAEDETVDEAEDETVDEAKDGNYGENGDDDGYSAEDGENPGGGKDRYSQTVICWHLKNGRQIYRRYAVCFQHEEVLKAYSNIYKTREYKEAVCPFILSGPEEMDKLNIVAGTMLETEVPFSAEEKQEFIDTYRRELLEQEADELVTAQPVAMLTSYMIRNTGSNGRSDEMYENYDFMIYPSFRESISMIERKGIDLNEIYSPGMVDEIEVEAYRGNDVMSAVFTDSEDISRILKAAKPAVFLTYNNALNPLEETLPGIDTMYMFVYYASSDIPENKKLYDRPNLEFSFPSGRVPDFVIEELMKE